MNSKYNHTKLKKLTSRDTFRIKGLSKGLFVWAFEFVIRVVTLRFLKVKNNLLRIFRSLGSRVKKKYLGSFGSNIFHLPGLRIHLVLIIQGQYKSNRGKILKKQLQSHDTKQLSALTFRQSGRLCNLLMKVKLDGSFGLNNCLGLDVSHSPETYSEPCQTSKIEFFAKIVMAEIL